jgi:hypothetical protein
MQNKEAAAQAHESRRALDEFKSGIDKASADLQSSLVITKSLLEEERRKNATLLQQVRPPDSFLFLFITPAFRMLK